MLINFTVANFKSIKENLLLNLTAAKRFKLDKTINVEKYGINVLPVTGIYGANGSGKTNLVAALKFMVAKILTQNTLPAVPFKFDSATMENGITSFSILFITKSNTMYHYGFSISGNRIQEEWLSCYLTKRETNLFTRIKNNEDKYDYHFGAKFISGTDAYGIKYYLGYIAQDLPPERLLLSEIASKNRNNFCNDVFSWFSEDLIIIAPDVYHIYTVSNMIQNKVFREKISSILRRMDFDFDSISFKTKEVNIEYILKHSDVEEIDNLRNRLENDKNGIYFSDFVDSIFEKTNDGKFLEKTLVIKHKRKDGSDADLFLAETSSGFKRMIEIVAMLIDQEANNKTFFIDEIERSLHTLISKNIIKTFLDNSIEQKLNCQLIFITHDTNLLDMDILRRDEIQFMEKDRETSSSYLTNYAEFKIIPGLNLEKGYLDGRFGAIPILHHNLK